MSPSVDTHENTTKNGIELLTMSETSFQFLPFHQSAVHSTTQELTQFRQKFVGQIGHGLVSYQLHCMTRLNPDFFLFFFFIDSFMLAVIGFGFGLLR